VLGATPTGHFGGSCRRWRRLSSSRVAARARSRPEEPRSAAYSVVVLPLRVGPAHSRRGSGWKDARPVRSRRVVKNGSGTYGHSANCDSPVPCRGMVTGQAHWATVCGSCRPGRT
jgi:hypothetical protein